VEVVNLAALACVLRTTTKKGRQKPIKIMSTPMVMIEQQTRLFG